MWYSNIQLLPMLAECSLAFILSCAILDVRTSSPSNELLAVADCMLRDPWDSTPPAKPVQEKIDSHIENIQMITHVFGREISINVIFHQLYSVFIHLCFNQVSLWICSQILTAVLSFPLFRTFSRRCWRHVEVRCNSCISGER